MHKFARIYSTVFTNFKNQAQYIDKSIDTGINIC